MRFKYITFAFYKAHSLSQVASKCVIVFPLIFSFFSGMALAQPMACDEGVIRLPDRSGTVSICSALASKIPQLAKQLTDATRLLGNQQEQIAELTRLVRGINGVSRGIGSDRQAQMLQSLSMELTASQKGGDEKTRRTIEALREKVEDLQSQMLSALSNQSTYAATSAAIKGPVGDSIAKLELSSASRQLDEVNARLQAIQGQISDVKNDTAVIKQDVKAVLSSLKSAAKEVSDDPRKELVKRGYTVDFKGLENAIQQKDFVAIEHFNNTGYIPTTDNFPRFLFLENWDAKVFKALSPKLLGAPKNCARWNEYIYTAERRRETLLGQIRVCGRDSILEILQARLREVSSKNQFELELYIHYMGSVPDIEGLRKTINPQKEAQLAAQPAAQAKAEAQRKAKQSSAPYGSDQFLRFEKWAIECIKKQQRGIWETECDGASGNAKPVLGISPREFAEIEEPYLKAKAKIEAEKKAWSKEIEDTIRWVKNVSPSVDTANR
jgi:uncharacterized coiled-coil protein SlyX